MAAQQCGYSAKNCGNKVKGHAFCHSHRCVSHLEGGACPEQIHVSTFKVEKTSEIQNPKPKP